MMVQMKQHLSTDAGKELIKKIGLVYQINISPKVHTKEGNPIATFSFKDDDFMKVATGKMNPQLAFTRYYSSPCRVGFIKGL